MADYIDREALKEAFWDACNNCLSEDDVADLIDGMPAADVAPVVHGAWIAVCDEMRDILKERDQYIMIRGYRCSRCGRFEGKTELYCHCGAKMDEEG